MEYLLGILASALLALLLVTFPCWEMVLLWIVTFELVDVVIEFFF